MSKNPQSSKDWLQSWSETPSHPRWYCTALTHLRPLICPAQPTGLSHPGNPTWLCIVDVFLGLTDLLSQQAPLGSWSSLCSDPLLSLSLGSPAYPSLHSAPFIWANTEPIHPSATHPPSYLSTQLPNCSPIVHPTIQMFIHTSTTQLPTHHLPSDYSPTHPSTHPHTHSATFPPPTYPSICIYWLVSSESPD